MSKERARAREARLAAREQEIAAAAEERARQARRAARRDRLRVTVPTPPAAVVRTLVLVGGVELIGWLVGLPLRVRLGLAVVTLAVLFVYVVSDRRPARRSPTR